HPTFYLRRKHYMEFGLYDLSFKQSADYELMLRMLYKQELNAEYVSKVMVKMRLGGASNVSLMNRLRANKEDVAAWKKNGLRTSPFTRFRKPLSKLGQYFKRG
ncbi:MAG: glycosyltransferase, partial [Salibacteraceae bacterium]